MAAGSVAPAPSAAENITRVLRHLGLHTAIYISRVEEDRIFGWPVGGDRLMRHIVLNGWPADLRESAERFHGSAVSFREPGVSPALQVVFHRSNAPEGYFVEMDLDFHAPQWRRPWTLLQHGLEVARNAVTGGKTNQSKIARALDRRFGQEVSSHA